MYKTTVLIRSDQRGGMTQASPQDQTEEGTRKMAANETKTDRARVPYTSFKTLLNTTDRMKEQGGAPSRVDRSYLSNMPGGERGIFMTGLKALGLVNEDLTPTADLHALVEADDEARKEIVRRIVERVYSEPLALPKRATQHQLESCFREYGIQGSTLRRAVSFFLAATEYAGIERSPHFRVPPRDRPKAKPKSTGASTAIHEDAPKPERQTPPAPATRHHPFIEGLIRELPEPGQPFPEEKQAAWFEIAKATFRLIYPVNKVSHDSGTAHETAFVTKQEDSPD